MSSLDDSNDIDALAEIVDALCDTLRKDGALSLANRHTMASIAKRARKLYRKRVDDDPTDPTSP